MSVRMAQMKLAHVPRFISRWHRHHESVFQREFVSCVNRCRRFQPPAHPDSASPVVADKLWHWTTAGTLTPLTKKNLDFVIAYCTKAGWLAPVPRFGPAELFKPLKTFDNVRDVKYWSQAFDFHNHLLECAGRTKRLRPRSQYHQRQRMG